MTTIGTPVTLPVVGTPDTSRQVKSGENGENPEKQKAVLKQVTREFEALFVGLMLKSMRSTVGTDSLTNGGRGEEVYRSLLDQEYAMEIARGGGLGLGTMLEDQLARHIGYSETDETRTKP